MNSNSPWLGRQARPETILLLAHYSVGLVHSQLSKGGFDFVAAGVKKFVESQQTHAIRCFVGANVPFRMPCHKCRHTFSDNLRIASTKHYQDPKQEIDQECPGNHAQEKHPDGHCETQSCSRPNGNRERHHGQQQRCDTSPRDRLGVIDVCKKHIGCIQASRAIGISRHDTIFEPFDNLFRIGKPSSPL